MKRILFATSVIFLSACQKKPATMTRYLWSSENHSKFEPKLEPEQKLFAKSASPVKLYDEIIEHSNQNVGGAIVESTYFHKISTSQGKLRYINAQFDEHRSLAHLSQKAEKLRNLRFSTLEIMKRKHLALKEASYIFEPEIFISGTEAQPKLQFQFEYIPKNGNGVYSMRVSPSYAIESIKKVELCFQKNRSLLFPTGPRLSELIEIFLMPLIGDGSLTSPRVRINSDDGQKALAENGEFIFAPEDPRFDQVQAFFFVQKTLDYAETQWDFNLPFPLKIGIKAGYPEKTNLMYYYKGLIRLGEGDGVSYKNIPQDPSIVSHEVSHAIIDSISAMGTEGEAASLNEGFADYITASLWQIPELGHTAFMKRLFTRTVDVATTFSERNGGTYHDSGILSGTFWDLEKKLGTKKTQMLALKTIARLGSQPTFLDVFPAVLDATKSSSFSEEDLTLVRTVFKSRGWPE